MLKMIALVLRNPHWLKEQSKHFPKANLMICRQRRKRAA
jgi:hypothetical protein